MSLELSVESNLSLEDIQRAHDAGQSVVRTAHVGNARPYNLAVAAMRIPLQLVDHTIVAQYPKEHGDNNYLPGSIVTAEGIQPLAVSNVGGLTMQTKTTDPSTGDTVFLDQFHTNNLRAAFPNTHIETNTEYIRGAEAVAAEVIDIALEAAPELFTRLAEGDGIIRKSVRGTFADSAGQYGILQLKDDPHTERGILIPNEVDIILGFVVEALRYGGGTQLHLSGPDFCNYAMQVEYQERFARLYETVRRRASFGQQLPETLRVKLIPATDARYVTAKGQGQTHQAIFDLLSQVDEITQEKNAFFTTQQPSDQARQEFIGAMAAKKRELTGAVGKLALASSDIFTGSQTAPFTSQYDVLKHGGITMPTQNTTVSMKGLRDIQGRIKHAREAAEKERQRGTS